VLLVVLAAAGWPGRAWAERAVEGRVVDRATGEPIVGALIAVGANEGVSDDHGDFRVPDVELGRLEVVAIADGYQAYFGAARVGAVMTIRMTADGSSGETSPVLGPAPAGAPLHLDTNQIRTQPGAGNDVLRALQSLPGVARTPYGLGGLALRGTAPRDTKVYLDGIEIPLLYHFGGLASFMPTGAVDEVTLEPGGASVRYGRGLGGVAVVTSKTGRRDRWRSGAELSLIHAAALAEGPGPLQGSWLIGARRSYFDAIIKGANLDLVFVPRYMDVQLRWESGDGRWMAFLVGSDDKLTLTRDPDDGSSGSGGGIDTTNVKSFLYVSRFARAALRYRAVRGATSITVLPSIGVDDINARANHMDIDKGMHKTSVPLSLRAEVATALAGGTLLAGFDGGWVRQTYDMVNTPPASPMNPDPEGVVHRNLTRWAADTGAYLEQSWFFFDDRLQLRPGLRGDHFGLSDQWTLDPRLTANLKLPNGLELIQSLGRYHAPPLVTDLDPIFGDRVMYGSSATQVATTVKTIVGDDKELSATAYYQDLRELPVDAVTGATPTTANGGTESGGVLGISRRPVDTQFGSYNYREANGTGHAYGPELIARKNVGTWTGWIAYTYARSYRRNPTKMTDYRPYVLDQPHSLTVVGTTMLGKHWRIGGRFRFTSGNPYTPVAGAYVDEDGDWEPIDGPLLSKRLPDFVQIDLRVDRVWKRPWGVLNLYIDLQNVINHKNAEGITYNADFSTPTYTRGLPIFPSIGVEYIP